MDFTREPIIETVITPKEGCTLVVRSSKSSGQEEHFVDAIEVVVFGNAIFFRSLERPKAFLVPASDYEVLEVRETRLVLKNVGLDRSIKIAGGREAPLRSGREGTNGKTERLSAHADKASPSTILPPPETHLQEQPTGSVVGPAGSAEESVEGRVDKKRDRRRNYRRRRGKDDEAHKSLLEESESPDLRDPDNLSVELPPPHLTKAEIEATASSAPVAAVLSSLLAPPPNLISETIARYKDNVLFKGAFFTKEEEEEELQNNSEGPEGDVEDSGQSNAAEEEFYPLPEHEESVEEIKVPNMTLDYPEYGSSEEPHSVEKDISEPQEISDENSAPLMGDVNEGDELAGEQESPQAQPKRRKKAEDGKGQEEESGLFPF